jgi:UDP:flavonoid glycosyltransferase YjiC (YdhE family)
MHFVFAANGTWGDVGPLADVASLLQRQGARITFISTPWFGPGLRERGLSPVTVGLPWDPRAALLDPRLGHPVLGAVNIWRDIFAPVVAPMLEATVAALKDELGVVVVHPWCLGAQLGAELVGAPWAMTALSPANWFSAVDVPMTNHYELPPWLARFMMRGPTRLVLNRVFGSTLDHEAKRYGLPRYGDRFFHATRAAALNLAFWPPQFRAPASDDPPNVVLCGFPAAARPREPLDDALEAFLGSGPAPIVMGLGSALPDSTQDVYDLVEEVAVELEQRVVLVGGAAKVARAGVLRVANAPYSALFGRARLVIHHGGIGTTAEALAAGRPQLVIPVGADQHDNAARLERLGVALRLPRVKLSKRGVRNRLSRLLDGHVPEQVATSLAAPLREAPPGVERARDALLGLAASHRAGR